MKKIISVAISFAMILSVTAFAADIFSDVTSDYWGNAYITEMHQRQVVNGYPEGDFRPENNVTRAEFAKMLAVISGKELDDKAENTFEDVPNDEWYVKYVNAVKSDFVTENGKFEPEEDATREVVAAAIAKEVGKAFDVSNLTEFTNTFSDSGEVSYMIAEDVADAYALEIIKGYPDGTFMPKASITRAEVCAMLSRAFPKKDVTNGVSGKEDTDGKVVEDYYKFSITTDKEEYSAGEDVFATVTINTNEYVAATEFVICYDNTFFEIEKENDNYIDEDWLGIYYDISGESSNGVIFPSANPEKGKIAIINFRGDGTEISPQNALKDAELIKIKFKIKEGVEGETTISLSKVLATNGTDKTRGSIAANDVKIKIK